MTRRQRKRALARKRRYYTLVRNKKWRYLREPSWLDEFGAALTRAVVRAVVDLRSDDERDDDDVCSSY